MKLDPRINNKLLISDPFDAETANKYIGRRGYFTDDIVSFSNLDNCCTGMLVSVESDNRHPYYCGIADGGAIISGNFSFFLSAEFVEEKPKEKKLRPYTFMEFQDKFTVGRPLKFREKGKFGCERYMILSGYWHELRNGLVTTYIYIGPHSYTLDELFNCYEWQEHYTSDFQPFGVEDTE